MELTVHCTACNEEYVAVGWLAIKLQNQGFDTILPQSCMKCRQFFITYDWEAHNDELRDRVSKMGVDKAMASALISKVEAESAEIQRVNELLLHQGYAYFKQLRPKVEPQAKEPEVSIEEEIKPLSFEEWPALPMKSKAPAPEKLPMPTVVMPCAVAAAAAVATQPIFCTRKMGFNWADDM